MLRTDARTDGQRENSIPPPQTTFVGGGITMQPYFYLVP